MEQSRRVAFDIPEKLAQEAESLGLDVDDASRNGLWLVMRQTRREAEWREENREAIAAYNRWFEENGLPLKKYRLF